ncbi:MAG: iron-sulfur cluster assembly scaffold protein [Planctomycetaceae bacterium]|nr:iron-sulfur cluster assembly scaffold protein [Planctomycetaceae bacterium]
MPSEEDIYQDHVLDHFEDPYHRGACCDATHCSEGENALCGDVVKIELAMSHEGRIEQAWFQGEGCVITLASASMLMEETEGKQKDDVKGFTAQAMLELFGPRLTPNRQKCCLLPWKVLQTAVHSPVESEGER